MHLKGCAEEGLKEDGGQSVKICSVLPQFCNNYTELLLYLYSRNFKDTFMSKWMHTHRNTSGERTKPAKRP
jgi:hypothetical protein